MEGGGDVVGPKQTVGGRNPACRTRRSFALQRKDRSALCGRSSIGAVS